MASGIKGMMKQVVKQHLTNVDCIILFLTKIYIPKAFVGKCHVLNLCSHSRANVYTSDRFRKTELQVHGIVCLVKIFSAKIANSSLIGKCCNLSF